MKKTEIPKLKDNELIRSYVQTYGFLMRNMNIGRGEKRLSDQCKALEGELIKRNLLTEEDVRMLDL